jgi:hypothetical protein
LLLARGAAPLLAEEAVQLGDAVMKQIRYDRFFVFSFFFSSTPLNLLIFTRTNG